MSEPHNISPSFAREAAHQLHDENVQRAFELCLAGTRVFPQYATGHLMLGKCYETLNQNAESLLAYRAALKILPDNATLQLFVAQAEEKVRALEEQRAAEEEAKKKIIPLTPPPVAKPEEPTTDESALEYLAKRLKDVKRIQPPPPGNDGAGAQRVQDDTRSVKFVTVTMAEIYARQEEFAEAIDAYKELLRRHPEDAEKFAKRIAELERLRAPHR